MPNHVKNKILFPKDRSAEIFASCCPEGYIDFNLLIPQPIEMYRGDLSIDDSNDFECNWSTWNRLHWGTKWNAYNGSCSVDDDRGIIVFDTAWSVPYPVIVAFANKFLTSFEHRYFDEGSCFWGIEEWSVSSDRASRIKKRASHPGDKKPLCVELKGYDPETDDDAQDDNE